MSGARETESREQAVIKDLLARLKRALSEQRTAEANAVVIAALQKQIAALVASLDITERLREAETAASRAEVDAARARSAACEAAKKLLEHEVQSLKQQLENQKRLTQQNQDKIARDTAEITALKTRLGELAAKVTELEAEMARLRLRSPAHSSQMQAVVKQAKTDAAKAQRVIAALREKNRLLQEEVARLSTAISVKTAEARQQQRDFAAYRIAFAELQNESHTLSLECRHLNRILAQLQQHDYSVGDLGRLYPVILRQWMLYHQCLIFFGATSFMRSLYELTVQLCVSYNQAYVRISSEPVSPGDLLIEPMPRLSGPMPMPHAPDGMAPVSIAVSGLGRAANPDMMPGYSYMP